MENGYWLVPTDERFLKALIDLNVSSTFKDRCLSNYNIPKKTYIFITYNHNKESDYWGWNMYKGELFDEYSESHNLKYKGAVNIPEYELVSMKYNL